jgi:hypothetical protein
MTIKTRLALGFIAATVVMFVIAPALIQSASAVATPKTQETSRCSDPKFADRESCPGKSEEASGGDREDENICVSRNAGQAKNCPPDSEVVFAER